MNSHYDIPNWYLLVQSQQWKHHNNMCNLFRVNNKDIRTTSLTSFLCIYVNFEKISHFVFDVSNVDFKKVNAGWLLSLIMGFPLNFSIFMVVCESK